MEEEINMAQSIMKRDLALHRVTEKQKKEQALLPPKEIKQEQSPVKDQDVVMADKPVEAPAASKPQPQATTRVMEPVKPQQMVAKPLPPSQPAPVAPMIAPQAAATAVPAAQPTPQEPPPAATTTTTAEQADQPEMPTAGGADDMDFSEFFDDLNPPDSGAEAANPAPDAQLDDALADFGDSADVSSLLPGLGDYANIPDDNPMPDAPPSSAPENAANNNEQPAFDFGDFSAPQQANNNAPQQPQQDVNAQPDFGDLEFNFDAGGGGDGGQQGDNTFNDLFDMDSYDFGGGGGGGGESDINDWMKSL